MKNKQILNASDFPIIKMILITGVAFKSITKKQFISKAKCFTVFYIWIVNCGLNYNFANIGNVLLYC